MSYKLVLVFLAFAGSAIAAYAEDFERFRNMYESPGPGRYLLLIAKECSAHQVFLKESCRLVGGKRVLDVTLKKGPPKDPCLADNYPTPVLIDYRSASCKPDRLHIEYGVRTWDISISK